MKELILMLLFMSLKNIEMLFYVWKDDISILLLIRPVSNQAMVISKE